MLQGFASLSSRVKDAHTKQFDMVQYSILDSKARDYQRTYAHPCEQLDRPLSASRAFE